MTYDHDTALAELDELGRHAATALRSAVATDTALPDDIADSIVQRIARRGGVAGAAANDARPESEAELDTDNVHQLSGSPRQARRSRPVLVAAALVAVAGLAAAVALRDDKSPTATISGPGAPTAALGDGEAGIYPPDATDRGYTVASPEYAPEGWQWTLDVPPAGEHLVVEIADGNNVEMDALAGIGDEALQVATIETDAEIPAGVVVVYGVVQSPSGDGDVAQVTVDLPAAGPVSLHVEDVPGATHDAFVGFLPGDFGSGVQVVASTSGGREIARVPLGATGTPSTPRGPGIYPPGTDTGPVRVSKENPDGTAWGGAVLGDGHYVVLGASGDEDSVDTVLDAPGSHPLQVLATRLDGETRDGARDDAVYGIVTAEATRVELVRPGAEPAELGIEPIDGATHNVFGQIFDRVATDAIVVAYDADGREIARQPLDWTIHDVAQQPPN